jgi:hypothetical protein
MGETDNSILELIKLTDTLILGNSPNILNYLKENGVENVAQLLIVEDIGLLNVGRITKSERKQLSTLIELVRYQYTGQKIPNDWVLHYRMGIKPTGRILWGGTNLSKMGFTQEERRDIEDFISSRYEYERFWNGFSLGHVFENFIRSINKRLECDSSFGREYYLPFREKMRLYMTSYIESYEKFDPSTKAHRLNQELQKLILEKNHIEEQIQSIELELNEALSEAKNIRVVR